MYNYESNSFAVLRSLRQSSMGPRNGYLNDKSNTGTALYYSNIFGMMITLCSPGDTPEPPEYCCCVTQPTATPTTRHGVCPIGIDPKYTFPNSNNRIYFISINGFLSFSLISWKPFPIQFIRHSLCSKFGAAPFARMCVGSIELNVSIFGANISTQWPCPSQAIASYNRQKQMIVTRHHFGKHSTGK